MYRARSIQITCVLVSLINRFHLKRGGKGDGRGWQRKGDGKSGTEKTDVTNMM